jgi:hypothetical protein
VNLDKKPIFEPLIELAHTQRFLLICLGLLGYLVGMILPILNPHIDPAQAADFGNRVFWGSLALAGFLQAENLAEVTRGTPTGLPGLISELFDDLSGALKTTIISSLPPQQVVNVNQLPSTGDAQKTTAPPQTLADALKAATMTNTPAADAAAGITVKGLPYEPPDEEATPIPDRDG